MGWGSFYVQILMVRSTGRKNRRVCCAVPWMEKKEKRTEREKGEVECSRDLMRLRIQFLTPLRKN